MKEHVTVLQRMYLNDEAPVAIFQVRNNKARALIYKNAKQGQSATLFVVLC